MPPRQYEGGGTSTFEALVGGTLGGLTAMEKLRGERRRQKIEEEDRANAARATSINEAILQHESGIAIDDGSGSSVAIPARVPASGGVESAAALPGAGTPFNPHAARIGPQLDDPVAPAAAVSPSATSSDVVKQEAPAIAPSIPRPEERDRPSGFRSRVGEVLGGIKRTAQAGLGEFQSGGYRGTPRPNISVTRTGPSSAERLSTQQHTQRMSEIGAREANDIEVAQIRAGAQESVARIRTAAAVARQSGQADPINRVLVDIDRQVRTSLARIRTLSADAALKSADPRYPETMAAAQTIRMQISAEQEVIQNLNTEREAMRQALSMTSPIGVSVQQQRQDDAFKKMQARAQALYQHTQTSPIYANMSDARRRQIVSEQLRKEGYDVQ